MFSLWAHTSYLYGSRGVSRRHHCAPQDPQFPTTPPPCETLSYLLKYNQGWWAGFYLSREYFSPLSYDMQLGPYPAWHDG